MQGLYVSSIILLGMNMLFLVYTLDPSRDLECVLAKRNKLQHHTHMTTWRSLQVQISI